MSRETIKDAQVALFRAIKDADPANYVRGQYDGYRSIEGVAPDSTTETYAALQLDIENWRWAGVPFFIRTGKRLPVTQTELRLVFKHPPRLGFAAFDREMQPNQLVVRLDPTTGIRLVVEAHRADGPGSIELDMEFDAEGGEGPTPYEVLLHAALVGRHDALHAPGRRRGDLAGDAAAPRLAASGSSVCAGVLGAEGRRRPRLRPRALARALDRRMTQGRSQSRAGAAERRGAFAVPADRRLRVPVELPHGRARRGRTARSTGSASRPSIPRASSAACSTARRGSSGSARTGSTIPPRASTSRERTCSSRPGRRRADGSSSATR